MARKNEPYIYKVLRRETPNPRQQAFFRAEAANIAYGGARGGGSRKKVQQVDALGRVLADARKGRQIDEEQGTAPDAKGGEDAGDGPGQQSNEPAHPVREVQAP